MNKERLEEIITAVGWADSSGLIKNGDGHWWYKATRILESMGWDISIRAQGDVEKEIIIAIYDNPDRFSEQARNIAQREAENIKKEIMDGVRN